MIPELEKSLKQCKQFIIHFRNTFDWDDDSTNVIFMKIEHLCDEIKRTFKLSSVTLDDLFTNIKNLKLKYDDKMDQAVHTTPSVAGSHKSSDTTIVALNQKIRGLDTKVAKHEENLKELRKILHIIGRE